MPILRQEYPGLKLSQYKQKLFESVSIYYSNVSSKMNIIVEKIT